MNDQPMAELPRYRCHKEVWALKIQSIRPSGDGERTLLVPENTTYAPIEATAQWMAKHVPREGGYWVQYKDGYTSFSPASAFEDGYTLVSGAPSAALDQAVDAVAAVQDAAQKPTSVDLTSLL